MAVSEKPTSVPRIGILNAHWSVHSSVGYLASHLVKDGYSVDVFLYRSDEELSGDLLVESTGITVYRCDPPSRSKVVGVENKNDGTNGSRQIGKQLIPGAIRRSLYRIKRFVLSKTSGSSKIIPKSIVDQVGEMARQAPYTALIGVEKGGLAWAGMVAQKTKCPLIYYSLELYTRDHPWVLRSGKIRNLKTLEEKYHRNCKLTIVQDEPRGRVLLTDNRVRNKMAMAYLPVSLTGNYEDLRSEWLQQELELPLDTVIILSYGMMNRQRRCGDIARAAQSFPENWRMVFHGYGRSEIIEEIQNIDFEKRVSISLRLVPAEQRQQVVSSAHVGLAIYDRLPLNDRLTGLSSEKIAMDLQCGLPLIAFRHQSYEHIEEERSGILIDQLEEIPHAIEKILKDYDGYVQRAYASYAKHYSFENNIVSVVASLRSVIDGHP